jgi:sulfur dioxygenase
MTLLLRQLYDGESGTYSYLLGDSESRECIIIDPVYERVERDLALIDELELKMRYSVETHCHADHVTAAWLLRQSTNCSIAAARTTEIQGLDVALADGDALPFGPFELQVLATPGHTSGCISLYLPEPGTVFTGDALLIRGCGRTDFQQGSAATLYRSITDRLFTLPEDTLVYPAHDYDGRTVSTIGEEKRLNPRIGGGANERDFVGFLQNLQLPHPKKIDVAVPANLNLGKPESSSMPQAQSWAPITTTYAGILEVRPQWVAANLDSVHVLDVRTRVETDEEPARIASAQLIPLDELRERLSEVPTNLPVVTLCRSGRRSVMAFDILRKEGWNEVANVKGGLLAWYAEGLPLAAASEAE